MPPAGLGEASVVLVWLVRLKMVLNSSKFASLTAKRRWCDEKASAFGAIGPRIENCLWIFLLFFFWENGQVFFLKKYFSKNA